MNQVVAENNFKYCEETFKLKNNIELNFLLLAERLKKIQDEKLYQPNYDKFHDFLNEININNSVASRLISIYELFVEKYKFKHEELIEAGGWSKLSEIVKVSTTKAEARKWLKVASTNPKVIIREMIEVEDETPAVLTCDDYYIIKICRDSKAKYVMADTRDDNFLYEKWHDKAQ